MYPEILQEEAEVCESEDDPLPVQSQFDFVTPPIDVFSDSSEMQCECIDQRHYDLSHLKLESNGIKLLSFDSGRDGFEITLQQKPDDLLPRHDMTISILPDMPQIDLHLDGVVTDISERQMTVDQESFRMSLLKALFVLFSTPIGEIPDQQRRDVLDSIEAIMMFSSDDVYLPKHMESPVSSASEMTGKVKVRYDRTSNFTNPRVTPDLVLSASDDSVAIVWRSEKSVSQKISEKIQKAMDRIPVALVDAMIREGKLETLKVEVIEDDLVDLRVKNALAFHQSGINLVGLRRSYVNQASVEQIASTIMHEFAHVIHPRQSDNYIQPYYHALLDQQSDSYYPFVSTYARYTEYEFFAESTVAYFNGEVDSIPANELLRGPRDRRELREKTPEIYLSLMIYFDPSLSSDCDEDFDVFDQKTFGQIANHLLTHPLNSAHNDRTVAESFLASLY